MILKGNQRGGARNLALHLMKEENERVELHELRGFASDNLMDAFNESYAVSKGTRCKQFLFSLSLNPPQDAEVSVEEFERAIMQAEERLGLQGQPRAIVFHEKEGRRHCHTVWSRIDTEEMKAIPLPFTHNKLQALSRELYLEHGWKMPRGLAESGKSDPRNFTLEEWQQAKRAGKDAKTVKTDFQDAWAISDNKEAYQYALEERGYKLARGDRRGLVAVDYKGEVYSLSRWSGVKPKELRGRLGEGDDLPSVAATKAQFADDMLAKMKDFQKETETKEKARQIEAEHEKRQQTEMQKLAQATLESRQESRQQHEENTRISRIRSGFWGFWDRLTGTRQRALEQNEAERQAAAVRDKEEKQKLLEAQIEIQRNLQAKQQQEQEAQRKQREALQQDTQHFQQMKQESEEEQRRKEFMEKRRNEVAEKQQRAQRPELER
jgi:hypothetical protein